MTFVSLTETGVEDELGNFPLAETLTDAPGCRHRPLTFTETAELQFDIGTKPWKSTIPVNEYSASVRDAVLAAKNNDLIRVDGVEYQIIGGVRHHVDMDGSPFKATVISEVKVG